MAQRLCPWWLGYMLINPIRKFGQDPNQILSPYLKPGMMVLEIGPGMGYFSIPMAKMVGKDGKIICVDVQQKMLNSLKKRALKQKVSQIIETRLCPENSLGIDDYSNKIDFVLAFAVVHEMPSVTTLFQEVKKALKVGGKFLIAEPTGHVSLNDLNNYISIANESGFTVVDKPQIKKSHSVLLEKK